MFQSSISPEEIAALEMASFPGEIVVVNAEDETFASAVRYLRRQKVLGFDTETRPTFSPDQHSTGTALLQLSGSGKAYLFRLKKCGLPRALAAILANPNIIKVGAATLDEMTVTDVMTPRVVAATAPESMTLGQFYKDQRFLHHSRIPVWTDNDDYITGYIMRLEALQLLADDKFDVRLGDIKREIASFPEDTKLDEVWDEMLTKDEQISIVIDEYGAFQGIVTLEDVIETILGDEIVDERDEVRDMQQFALERWKKRSSAKVRTKPEGEASSTDTIQPE